MKMFTILADTCIVDALQFQETIKRINQITFSMIHYYQKINTDTLEITISLIVGITNQ